MNHVGDADCEQYPEEKEIDDIYLFTNDKLWGYV